MGFGGRATAGKAWIKGLGGLLLRAELQHFFTAGMHRICEGKGWRDVLSDTLDY